MKILFTGGGSGGHFYPIIAIAEELRRIAREERLILPELFFMAPGPYDARLLFDQEIAFLPVTTGKLRRYFSLQSAVDILRTVWGILQALAVVFRIFPDVVVGKGGFGSFPALFAARTFKIPVLIHESDSIPGKVNAWAGKFARRVAVSFPSAAQFFPREPKKIAYTGNPIRAELLSGQRGEGLAAFGLGESIPVILVLGGSLGSVTLNNALLTILPKLLETCQVVHQTGMNNVEDVKARTSVLLQRHPFATRYRPAGYLSAEELAHIAAAATLIISRAGSTIFEIAAWGIPAILVPIADSNGDHQRQNAYEYAKMGSALVIEEYNLKPTILLAEIEKIVGNDALREQMATQAKRWAKIDAATVIAREIIDMALRHEK